MSKTQKKRILKLIHTRGAKMKIKKNGYKNLLIKVEEILEDTPQDIVDEEEGIIYTGGLWELVSPRDINEDESISDSLKAELLENPRKIGSANLMYVQTLVEKYCENNPTVFTKLPKTANVVSIDECVKSFTTHVLDELIEEKKVRVMPHIKREQSFKLVVDNTQEETSNVSI
tara:strand:+ start:2233 stop:2751 length:519 start_codon:yes stop_codon:yes gene_type:complete